MQETLVLAVDLGTSFIKTAVYDLQGHCAAQAKEPVRDDRPGPGIFLQEGEALAQSVLRCIRRTTEQLGKRASAVAAIGFTGQMAGFMGVDENWQDVTGWSCSLDTRYAPWAERQLRTIGDQFMEISGTNNPLFSAKCQWFREEFPEEEKRIAKYLMISGYILGKLGDLPISDAVIDGSLITWTGLADVRNRQWSKVLYDRLEVDPGRLPRIAASSETVTRLSGQAAAETGLQPGIPLVCGAGDKIAGCVGAANLRKGSLLYEAGSFGGISFCVEDYRPDREKGQYDLLNGCEPGKLYAHYYMPGSGLTLDWFLQNFVHPKRPLGELHGEMDQRLAAVPAGSEGLMAVGMLSGSVMPFDPTLKGVWMGHTLAHRPEHFYRALAESFGYALSGAIGRMETIYPEQKADCLRIIGGGAKSAVMSQMLADIVGKPVEVVGREDCSLWGACILAAKGAGLFENVTEFAESGLSIAQVYEPDPRNHDIYRNLQTRYEQCLQTVSPLFSEWND